ncbi:MAG: aminotransferase IV, partial [Flavobacteriales bacterium]|nr:aminotransferase IV [Flavobacteriales bacterium]
MIQQFDDRNKDIKVWINGDLLNRNEAKISVFDSVVQGGDSVWE